MKDKEPQDLTSLVEQHAKEVWALKQELSKASEEITILRGTKEVVVRLSNELVRMKKRAQEAEGENTIIKGSGDASPKMKELQARVEELEQSPDYQKLLKMWREEKDRVQELEEINDKHQRYNGELQTRVTELKEDNKKLSHQVEDKINQMRKSGM